MTTKEPVAVQRYDISYSDCNNTDMVLHEEGTYVTFEDYQRDIAAAERRGAEKFKAAVISAGEWTSDGPRFIEEMNIRSLPIEQILKGE